MDDHGSRTDLLEILREETKNAAMNQHTIELIYDELIKIKELQKLNADNLEKVTEILEAWNNAKGFVKTSMMIVNTVKWVLIAAGTLTAAYYWITGRLHV